MNAAISVSHPRLADVLDPVLEGGLVAALRLVGGEAGRRTNTTTAINTRSIRQLGASREAFVSRQHPGT
jgi:hypothetical protein